SVFDEALGSFVAKVQNEQARNAVQTNLSVISDIYHQAEINNWRILQQTIWDLERVHACLEERHQVNKEAITTLLGLLFALSFEVKIARLSEHDLKNRQHNLVMSYALAEDAEQTPSPWEIARNRYPTISLDSTLLSDGTLVDI